MSKNKKRRNVNSFDQRLFYHAKPSLNDLELISKELSKPSEHHETNNTDEQLTRSDDCTTSTSAQCGSSSGIASAHPEPNTTDPEPIVESDDIDECNRLPEPTNLAVKFQISPRPAVEQKTDTDSMQLLIRGYGPK